MKIQESAEDYLEAILILKNEKGLVHSIDVARRLEFSRERGSALSAAALALGPKVLALCLLGLSAVRLLSSTFRSFLYFQF